MYHLCDLRKCQLLKGVADGLGFERLGHFRRRQRNDGRPISRRPESWLRQLIQLS